MLRQLPNLTLLPLDSLLIHEQFDAGRTRPLMVRIRYSGIFRNPPIVSRLEDGSERYMVLDGANRVTALRELGCLHALVQVVQPGDPGVSLQTWNHAVWELSAIRFLSGIRDLPGVRLAPTRDEASSLDLETGGLALVKTCKGHTYVATTEESGLSERVAQLNALVDSYRSRGRLDYTTVRDVRALADIYPQFGGLVIFPALEIRSLLRLVGSGCLLPAEITRFTVSPRALHLDYPLHELLEDHPLEEKKERLHKWLQSCLERKQVRFYAEATVLFDE